MLAPSHSEPRSSSCHCKRVTSVSCRCQWNLGPRSVLTAVKGRYTSYKGPRISVAFENDSPKRHWPQHLRIITLQHRQTENPARFRWKRLRIASQEKGAVHRTASGKRPHRRLRLERWWCSSDLK